MRMDKFTIKAQEAVSAAVEGAQQKGHPQVDGLHLLDALLADAAGTPQAILGKIGADLGRLRQIVQSELGRLPVQSGGTGQAAMSPSFDQAVRAAQDLAARMQDQYVSTEHLLLGVAQAGGKAGEVLAVCGVREADLLEALKTVRDMLSKLRAFIPPRKWAGIRRRATQVAEKPAAAKPAAA